MMIHWRTFLCNVVMRHVILNWRWTQIALQWAVTILILFHEEDQWLFVSQKVSAGLCLHAKNLFFLCSTPVVPGMNLLQWGNWALMVLWINYPILCPHFCYLGSKIKAMNKYLAPGVQDLTFTCSCHEHDVCDKWDHCAHATLLRAITMV